MSDPVPEFLMVSRWLLWEAGFVRPGVYALESACLTGPLFSTYSGENLGQLLNLSALYLRKSALTETQCMRVQSLSCPTHCNPWTVARQAPLSMECPRQAYWSGLPFPTSGDLPNAGTEPASPAWQVDALPLSHHGSLLTHSSVQFSRSVVSDSLRPHESQHARPPCPSPTPGVHSDSCPWSRWCHPAISSSVVPFSSCPQSLPASESFPMSQLFAWGGQSIGVSASILMSDWHTVVTH